MIDFAFNIPWDKVLSLSLVNFFAIASPGPALIVQMKQSMTRGFRLGLIYAFGVAVGIGIHLLYTFMGLAQVISSYSWLETAVILLAVCYFTYLFWGLAKASFGPEARNPIVIESSNNPNSKAGTPRGSFWLGVFISGINPNAVVFIITIFAPQIDKSWTLFSCALMLVWLCLCCFGYYALLNSIFSNHNISKYYFKYKHWFDRVIAIFFLYLIICFTAKLLPTEWIEPIGYLFYF